METLKIGNDMDMHSEITRAIQDFLSKIREQCPSWETGDGLIDRAVKVQGELCLAILNDLLAIRVDDDMQLSLGDTQRKEVVVRALQDRLGLLNKQIHDSVGGVRKAVAQCAKLIRHTLRKLKAPLQPPTELEADVVDELPG